MLTNFAPMQWVRMPVHVRGMGLAFECMLDLWGEQSSSGRSYTRCPTTDDPPDLPDGRHYLELGKFVVQTGKFCGEWDWSSSRLTFKNRLPEK